ncbi:hypothetical protein Memar_1111 [Methanoculleus marisnigri JR1]|uniref:Uncharacterized protein n=1 Tax=Methanoculleus marisnigri (strain ATCC 35101 / DSM 1498 / JR1) TaxID=368407 RepID=A3CUJ3_METMJ|nr:hypothetical protein Memar_1111 [Methanoculleus marisnigri JR1]
MSAGPGGVSPEKPGSIVNRILPGIRDPGPYLQDRGFRQSNVYIMPVV